MHLLNLPCVLRKIFFSPFFNLSMTMQLAGISLGAHSIYSVRLVFEGRSLALHSFQAMDAFGIAFKPLTPTHPHGISHPCGLYCFVGEIGTAEQASRIMI